MIMKKKVLFVITKPNWGGAQRYVFDLATALPKERYDVALAVGGEGELTKRLEERNIPAINIPSLKRDISLIAEFRAFSALKDTFMRERPDIVHLNSSKAGALGALAARAAGVKRIVFTAHGWPFREPRNPFWKIFTWFGSLMTGWFADVIISVSDKDRRTSPIPWKTVLIRNGVTHAKAIEQGVARAEIELRARHDIPKDMPWIGAVAELHKNKGLRYLIEAMKWLPRAILVIVGDGELRLELESFARKFHVSERVFFTGGIADAGRLIPAFDVFALPSLKEGLPYVILEAMAAGVPVVATRVGGVPEEIEDGKSGTLVPTRNPRALAKALERLAEDPALSGKFADAAHARVIERFDLERMVREIDAVYEGKRG
jgi:glycosyltransferase involved in cell wall biosynthesis